MSTALDPPKLVPLEPPLLPWVRAYSKKKRPSMVIGIPTAIQIPSWWICALCINSPSLVYIPTLIRSFFYISTYDDDMCACSMRCKLSRTIPMWTFQFKLVQVDAVFTESEHRNLLFPPPWHGHHKQQWYPTDSLLFLLKNYEQTLRHCYIPPMM